MPPAACRILLLFEDPAARQALLSALAEAGFRHVSASSSIAGARQCWHAQAGKFDLFLTNSALGESPVADLVEELIRAKSNLHIVLVASPREDVLKLNASVTRSLTWIEKSVPPADLVQTVSSKLSGI